MDLREDSFGFVVVDVFRLWRQCFQELLAGSFVTFAQARILVHVLRHEGLRQVDLARLLETQPISLARQIDQLAEQGLIERRPDISDRRAYRLYLTSAAAPHLAEIERVADILQSIGMNGLDEAERTTVLKIMRIMRSNLLEHKELQIKTED